MNNQLPFSGKKKQAPAEQLNRSWSVISAQINNTQKVTSKATIRWFTMAAAAALLLSVFTWQKFFVNGNQEWKIVTTGYGERKRIVLPDGSVVVLNSNSTLKVPANWMSHTSRSVWLTGEGYFEVTKNHQPGMAEFIVHTSTMKVRVLGTKFNVNAYSNQPTVALKEGRVEVIYNHKATTKTIVILPGEVVKLNIPEKIQPALILPIEQENIADWTSNTYHFEQTPLQEIADMIYNRFGYRMQFTDSAIANRTLDGHLFAANLVELVNAIEVTFTIKIEKNDNDKSLLVSP